VVATDSGWRMLDPAALGFSLEQGPRLLGASFASVDVVRPSDVGRVVVSDTTVITDYLTSVADAYGRHVGRPWREVVDAVLTELVAVATRDAHPIEVTPPVSPGEDWTEQRVEWLRSLHRDRRGGLGHHRSLLGCTSGGHAPERGATHLGATTPHRTRRQPNPTTTPAHQHTLCLLTPGPCHSIASQVKKRTDRRQIRSTEMTARRRIDPRKQQKTRK